MKRTAIPGPRGLPILGSAIEFLRDPLSFLSETARVFGPVAEIRLGPQRLVLFSRPQEIEDVLVRKADAFCKSALLRDSGRLVMGQAIDALDGEAWSERIQKVAPAFRKGYVERYTRTALEVTEAWIAELHEGETRRLDLDFLALALRVQMKALLGTDLAHTEAAVLGAAFGQALDGWNAKLGSKTPDWLPTPSNVRLRRSMALVRGAVGRAIESRRRGSRPADTALDLLLEAGLPPRVLCDELTVLAILGGHQLSLALAWTVAAMTQHPAVEARFLEETDGSYAGWVFDEALRLYPPFYLLVRDATRDVELGGIRLARGVTAALSPWVTHRSPLHWEDPDVFRPERWAKELAERLPPYAYFPFGGGLRACIAKAMVRAQAVSMLSTVLRRVRLVLAPGARVEPRAAVALRLRHGLPMTVRWRR